MTSDTHLPPEKRRQLPHMVWAPVFPDIRYARASPSHLLTSVDKQLLPKTATLLVLCYICLNSLLVPPCWRHFPESSMHFARSMCRDLGAARRPGPGAASPGRALGPPWQLSPSARSFRAGGRLEGTPLPAWPESLLRASCRSQQLDLLAFWGVSGSIRRPPPEIMFWMSPCVQTALSPSSCQTPRFNPVPRSRCNDG